jgi:hypothetical protein
MVVFARRLLVLLALRLEKILNAGNWRPGDFMAYNLIYPGTL